MIRRLIDASALSVAGCERAKALFQRLAEVEAAIQENLYALMEGKTVIAVAHRLSTIAAMDRLVVMDQGRIVEEGSHRTLLHKGGLYASLWQRQSGGFLAAEAECKALLEKGWGEANGNSKRHLMALPAYDQCIKASHAFNLLDARGVISVTERQSYILRVRDLAKACCEGWLATQKAAA